MTYGQIGAATFAENDHLKMVVHHFKLVKCPYVMENLIDNTINLRMELELLEMN